MNRETKLEKLENNIELFILYKKLLTEKQIEIFSLYYEQDLSLEEISKNKQISKVAVHDSLKKTILQLQKFENYLNFSKKISILKKELKNNHQLIDEIFYS